MGDHSIYLGPPRGLHSLPGPGAGGVPTSTTHARDPGATRTNDPSPRPEDRGGGGCVTPRVPMSRLTGPPSTWWTSAMSKRYRAHRATRPIRAASAVNLAAQPRVDLEAEPPQRLAPPVM
jgi:hypothetical protein